MKSVIFALLLLFVNTLVGQINPEYKDSGNIESIIVKGETGTFNKKGQRTGTCREAVFVVQYDSTGFDEVGNILESKQIYFTNGGFLDLYICEKYIYSENILRSEARYEIDREGDTTFARRYEYSYPEKDTRLITYFNENNDSVSTDFEKTTYSEDSRTRLISRTSGDYTMETITKYDTEGNIVNYQSILPEMEGKVISFSFENNKLLYYNIIGRDSVLMAVTEFNERGLPVSEKEIYPDHDSEITYSYVYDDYGNYVEKWFYVNGKACAVERRTIIYRN